jgi:hypothetical protein
VGRHFRDGGDFPAEHVSGVVVALNVVALNVVATSPWLQA